MYTHSRQFPHLEHLDDQRIREVAKRAMDRHPRYRRMMAVRNFVAIAAVVVGPAVLVGLAGWKLGKSMMLLAGTATVLILVWNLVWVNTTLFRITQDELNNDSRPL